LFVSPTLPQKLAVQKNVKNAEKWCFSPFEYLFIFIPVHFYFIYTIYRCSQKSVTIMNQNLFFMSAIL